VSVQLVVEGPSDIPVATKLVEDAGLEVATVLDMRGCEALDESLSGFNQAAKLSPWVVIRDLDLEASCAPEFLRRRSFRPSTWMSFRIAVRELESWLLADAEALAEFLFIAKTAVPSDPDLEQDPKRALVNLARQSTKKLIREGMTPKPGRAGMVGPLYQSMVIDFSVNHWSLSRAVRRSPSLRQARRSVWDLARRWRLHIGE
jgi:hypothetical protein